MPTANQIVRSLTDPGCDINAVNPIQNMPFMDMTQNITHINPNQVVANKTMGELLDSNILYTAYGGYYLKDGDNYSSKDVAVNIHIGKLVGVKVHKKRPIRGFFLASDSKFIYLCKSHKIIDHVINMVMFPAANVSVSQGKDFVSGAVIHSCGNQVVAIPYASASIKVLSSKAYDWGSKRGVLMKSREEAVGYHDNNYLPAVHDPVLKSKDGNVMSQQASFKPNPTVVSESNQNEQPGTQPALSDMPVLSEQPNNTTQEAIQEEKPMAEDRLTTLKSKAIEDMASDKGKASSILATFAEQITNEGGHEELVEQLAKMILSKAPSKEDKAAIQEAVFDNI